MSYSEPAGRDHGIVPPPPITPDGSEVVVNTAPEKHFPGKDYDLVQSVDANGDTAWVLRMKSRPDIEKAEPVRDDTAQDH